jgi:hypothetical protein
MESVILILQVHGSKKVKKQLSKSGMSNWRAACGPIACLMRPATILLKHKVA